MAHTIDGVGEYLLGRGLLEPADVVDGPFSTRDVSRRNRNLAVSSRDGRGYLVKQANPNEPGTAASLRVEAAFYRLCWSESSLSSLRPLLPRLVEAGVEEPTLVLELLEGALPLWQHCSVPGPPAFPWRVGPALGRALGQLHATFRGPVSSGESRLPGGEGEPPWILAVHRPEPACLDRLSPANLHLLKIVQRQPGLKEQLDAVRSEWRIETLVHGDIKSDNVLVGPEPDPASEPRVRLVDWELVHAGDPAWDVGSAIADFVAFWLESVPLSSLKSVHQQVAEARYPLSAIRPALRGLWQRYREAAAIGDGQAGAFLHRAIRYGAARLIQTAYERSSLAWVLPNVAIGRLQLAANLLADPVRARCDLFGIGLREDRAARP